MRNPIILVALFASFTVAGCKQIECAEGTVERDGTCEPANTQTNAAMCGPFTELQGDRCVPQFPPTVCDPATTMAILDPTTNVTTCIGTGGGGCSAPIACPAGAGATKLTVCGQLYDFEDNAKLAASGASGTPCDPANPATSGPCALQILAFDAVAFASSPSTATPLPAGGVYIDDCGRYRLTDIETTGTGPYIGLGIDDAGQAFGPTGTTVTVGLATTKPSSRFVANFEGWIVRAATAGMWQSTGGPPLSGGIYAAIFRQHKLGNGDLLANQAGATITRAGATLPSNDHYFAVAELAHRNIDAAATMTGANGTGLLTGASLADGAYAGQGGLGTGCEWEPHAAASLPGVVFIQVFRKIDSGMTCND